ncbi:MAG: GyrI-like domain-containing protein [Kineosporiaceae bacterium]
MTAPEPTKRDAALPGLSVRALEWDVAAAEGAADGEQGADGGREGGPPGSTSAAVAAAVAEAGVSVELVDRLGGRAVSLVHHGPYTDEGPSVAALRPFAAAEGLTVTGPHTETYLTDPNRTPPAGLRTRLRYPVADRGPARHRGLRARHLAERQGIAALWTSSPRRRTATATAGRRSTWSRGSGRGGRGDVGSRCW